MTDELLTAAQAAKRLHVSRSTVQRMITDGRLKGRKLPGGRTSAFLIDEADVRRLVTELEERERAS